MSSERYLMSRLVIIMDNENLKALLKELGLNEYESRAYLVLIESGSLTAGELAALSGVPQPRIYDTIRTLMTKGMVTVTEDRPKRIMPLDPAQVFKGMQERYNRLISQVEKELGSMYNPVNKEDKLTVVKSRVTLERYIGDSIRNTQFSISIAAPGSLIRKFESDLKKKVNEGTQVHIFMYGTKRPSSIGTIVKIREIPDPILLISDRDIGIYTPYYAFDPNRSSLQGYALIIRDSNLLFIFNRYFYHALWPTGKTIYRVERPLKVPKKYIDIRNLIEDIRNFNLIGAKVKIKGRLVKSGKPIEIVGRVLNFYESEGKVLANVTVETEDRKKYVVGGWNASLEDVEADMITLLEG